MNITKTTEEYISQHPSIKDNLAKDLINFSSLSRMVIKETKMTKRDFDAVLIACRRYQSKLRKEPEFSRRINDILADSKIEIKTGIVVFVIEGSVYYDHLLEIEKKIKQKMEVFHIIEGVNTITLITTEDFLDEINDLFKNKIVRENSGLVEVIIKTSKSIERTPGVLSYLYSLFGDHNINIYETMSSWTDTLFLISEDDLEKAVKVLKFR